MPDITNDWAALQRTAPVQVTANKRADAQTPEQLKQACRDFESIFINYMLRQMRETVPQNELLGGGQAEKLYVSMFDSEVAKNISQQRGIGLAPMMYHQMASMANHGTTKK